MRNISGDRVFEGEGAWVVRNLVGRLCVRPRVNLADEVVQLEEWYGTWEKTMFCVIELDEFLGAEGVDIEPDGKVEVWHECIMYMYAASDLLAIITI